MWFLARGITSPLREMVDATEAMARGDFSQRVTATSHDEIGTLARSFNQMAAELAETDRLRRDLVANVSHELRTPITALQAVLENIVDGVEPPDPETLAHDARPGRAARPAGAAAARPVATRVRHVPLDRRPFDVEPMLEHAVRESRLARRDVTLDGRGRPAPISSSRPTPSVCTRSSRTSSRTRCGTRRRAARVAVRAIATADGASRSK